MGEQTRQLCGEGGEVEEKTRLLHRWVKNHSPLDTHFPPEPLCLRVQGMCVLLYAWYPLTCFSALSGSCWASKLDMPLPLFFPSCEVSLHRQLQGSGWHPSQSWSVLCPELSTVPTFLRRPTNCHDSHPCSTLLDIPLAFSPGSYWL